MQRYLVKGLSALVFALGASIALAQGRPDLVEQSLRNPAREHVGRADAGSVPPRRRGRRQGPQRWGASTRRSWTTLVMTHQRSDGKGDLHLVRLPFGLSVAAAMRGLQNDATVEFAEPNWIYRHQADLSNDTYYTNGSLWGMYGDATSPANAYGSQAGEAWAAAKERTAAACGSASSTRATCTRTTILPSAPAAIRARPRATANRRRRQRLRR